MSEQETLDNSLWHQSCRVYDGNRWTCSTAICLIILI